MKNTVLKKNAAWFFLIASLWVLGACKKHYDPTPGNHNGNKSSRLSMEDSLKYYVWYYMESDSDKIPQSYWYSSGSNDIHTKIPQYFWYDQVPDDFDPLSPEFKNADSVLSGRQGLASYSLLNGNGEKLDRYSFLDRTGAVSGEILNGQLGDKGFDIRWAVDKSSDSSFLYVAWAYANGPAGLAHVQRGWEITAVNGDSHVSYDGPGFGDGSADNANRVLNAVFGTDPATFTFSREGLGDTTISISNAQYDFNPILFDTIYNVNGTKVGYFVYNSFVSVYSYDNNGNEVATTAKSQIDDVFDKFQTAGIKDLIIDERYNGGGAGNAAEYLDNLIVPASETGQIMYSYAFNTPIENYLKSQNYSFSIPFQKQGDLALDHVFFIVSYGTVSAAELTINNLKPVMDVKLIGSTTYGKPFGFVPQPINIVNDTTGQEQHVADLYDVNMQVKNQAGYGDYYNGMTPDKWNSDFVDLNWGDLRDSCLLEALEYVRTNNWVRASPHARVVNQKRPASSFRMNRSIINRKFNGMIDQRLNFRNPAMLPFKKR